MTIETGSRNPEIKDLDLETAKKALLKNAAKKGLYPKEELEKNPVDFSIGDLDAISRSWDKLGAEIQDLTKSAFPEVSAYLLAKKLETNK